jgi:hypothetical protein
MFCKILVKELNVPPEILQSENRLRRTISAVYVLNTKKPHNFNSNKSKSYDKVVG